MFKFAVSFLTLWTGTSPMSSGSRFLSTTPKRDSLKALSASKQLAKPTLPASSPLTLPDISAKTGGTAGFAALDAVLQEARDSKEQQAAASTVQRAGFSETKSAVAPPPPSSNQPAAHAKTAELEDEINDQKGHTAAVLFCCAPLSCHL